MAKEIPSLISSRAASLIYGIITILTGADYFYFAKQITLLLPSFLPKTSAWAFLMGLALIMAGFAIIINKQITRLACNLLVVLLFIIVVGIDLRAIFNLQDEFKVLYIQSLLKDTGLIAGAMIIANFEREVKHRKGRHRIKSRSESGASSEAI
jgi:uncharacterized membrane protein